MHKACIVVIDDEPKIVRLLTANLKTLGYEVHGFAAGPAALAAWDELQPDLLILDLMLPEWDGFTILERLRRFSAVPVLMLTARDQCDDKVRGLNLGADDYLTKPFALAELFARVQAILRRTRQPHALPASTVQTLGALRHDQGQCRVWAGEQEVRFTSTEYKLFALLMRHSGKVLTHEFLLQAVWGPEYGQEVEYLRVAIARMRSKLKAALGSECTAVKTYPGIGYSLQDG